MRNFIIALHLEEFDVPVNTEQINQSRSVPPENAKEGWYFDIGA